MNDFHVHLDNKIYKLRSIRMWIPKILFNTDLLSNDYRIRYLISSRSRSNYLNLIIGTACIYRGCDDPIAFNEIFRALQKFDSINPKGK
jgi:hypothetical protein